MDAKIDQCDQWGHKGPSYLILVPDFGKGSEMTGAKHSSHLAYPTHVGIGFPISECIEFNMVEEKVVTLGFNRETLKPFPTSLI